MEPLPRLPGLTFETPPQVVATALPRMDVTALVGLAAAGPLHVPVAVADASRFRDVFGVAGRDLELAWDDERGEVRRAHLGAAVEGFFAGGGRSCWVVRVADEGTAVRHRFPLPGLAAAGETRASPQPAVLARARAKGTWCEDLRVGTALEREPLPLHRPVDGDAEPAFVLGAGGYRLDLAVGSGRLRTGDLLEVVLGPGWPVLLLFVHRVEPGVGRTRATGAPLPRRSPPPETPGAFWAEPAAASPPVSPPAGAGSEGLLPLPETEGLDLATAWLGSPPAADRRPAVRRLSFEISVWRGTELVARLGQLAFDRRHPRFWAALPTDEVLFRELLGRRAADPEKDLGSPGTIEEVMVSPVVTALAHEASEPRFPLAGPGAAAAAQYLPLAMGIERGAEAARGLIGTLAGTRLQRDGLGRFGASLFLDSRLAGLYRGTLMAEAEHHFYLRGRRLRGIHSLLPLAEVSLVAVPDAVHRGWSREAPETDLPFGAPQLGAVGDPDAAGRYPLSWTAVAQATGYYLERDADPAFSGPAAVFSGAGTAVAVVLPPGCPGPAYFRVRALRDGAVGPWSNTVGARLPAADFAPCAGGPPSAFRLLLDEITGGSHRLRWQPAPADNGPLQPAPPPPAHFEIEEAADAAFAGAEVLYRGAGTAFDPPRRRDGVRYYRLRGVTGELPGSWSNTVAVLSDRRAAWTEPPAARYSDVALLAVQRALLRFCAARADLMALLSVPGHYREEDALVHRGRLTPGGSDEVTPAAIAAGDDLRVPPLTLGETPVLCWGALYHPWLTVRSSQAVDGGRRTAAPLTRTVPDGAVAGSLAALALDRGAWLAPANRALAGVLALSPRLPDAAWERLAAARVNVLLRSPRGFLALSEDTLSAEEACRPIHVRRLLILLRRLALREGERFVFEPNSADLRDRIRHRFEQLLRDLYRRGAFAGATPRAAFRVRVDETVNPRQSVELGRLIVELAVAPAPALAYLIVRLVAGPDQLTVEEV